MQQALPPALSSDELSITIRAVRVSGKQMTLAVFKQLPVVDLYTEEGVALEPIRPWGIVRQEIKEISTWLLLEYNGLLHKAPVDVNRFPQSEIEAGIRLIQSSLQSAHAIPSLLNPKLKRLEWLNKHEDNRVALHREAIKYPQLYITA